jgi:hypothetical protein
LQVNFFGNLLSPVLAGRATVSSLPDKHTGIADTKWRIRHYSNSNPPPSHSPHRSTAPLAHHAIGRWLYSSIPRWCRGGVGGVWFGVDGQEDKAIPVIPIHPLSIALALPFVHKITGCPALIWMLNEGFQLVGSTTWEAAIIPNIFFSPRAAW